MLHLVFYYHGRLLGFGGALGGRGFQKGPWGLLNTLVEVECYIINVYLIKLK